MARQPQPVDTMSPLIVMPIPKGRSYFVFLVITVLFLLLAIRVFWLQVYNSDFLQGQGEARYARTMVIPGVRGEILDRNGVVLASSQPVRSIWADPQLTNKATSEEIKKLAQTLDIPYKDIAAKLKRYANKNFVYLARNITVSKGEAVRALGIPGVGITPEALREYPDGEVMAHIVGFTGWNDHGQEGVELASDKTLSGQAGARRVIKDRRGRIVDDVWAKEAKPGKDVVLSIDSRIQFIAHQALMAQMEKSDAVAGAAVVADVRTGEILALVNAPTYDPNDRTTMVFDRVRNRVLTDQFEPGSTMKPFAIAKALDLGIVGPQTTIDTSPGKLTIGDRTIGDTHDYGVLSVTQIIAKSSNIGTTKIALEMSPQTLWDMYTALGFGRVPDIGGFPGATAGRLKPANTWRPIEQATISYGHGVTVSLLQMVRAYTALARNGDAIDLTLYKRDPNQPIVGEQVYKPETARLMRAMMMNTVSRGGTADRVRVSGYSVAGKTGTANKVKNGRYTRDTVASFVGITPATNPRIIVAVMIDDPRKGSRYGGSVAGPVFGAIATGALRTLAVMPDEGTHNASGNTVLDKVLQ